MNRRIITSLRWSFLGSIAVLLCCWLTLPHIPPGTVGFTAGVTLAYFIALLHHLAD